MTRPGSDRLRVRRSPRKGRYDRESVEAVLDRGLVAHVAFADDGPVCVPMLYARIGGHVYVHGSTASRAMRRLGSGTPACLTVTNIHGLVLARSVFEHTANYEAVMVFGTFRPVEGDERLSALEAFTERLLPGRWSEVRAPSAKELKATAVVALELGEASVKVRTGPPDDDDSPDAAIDTWAGVIPLTLVHGEPEPSPGLRPGVGLSPSVRRLLS
ncbi:MAG: pyridoxamine 5'-phosphate oxidase family protein [Micromonosporaceae bacterium]